MVLLKEILDEMAAPREGDLAKTYYHGTKSGEAAKAIMQNGIQPPDMKFILSKYRSSRGTFVPIKGKIYITPSLQYALIYGLGGDVAGHPTKVLPNDYENQAGYAYIFVIEGSQLKDIQPDEDSVGEILERLMEMIRKNAGTENIINPYYNFNIESLQWLIPLAREVLVGPNGWKKLKGAWFDVEASDQTRWGKKLLGHMTDSQKLQLIDAGAHIAHTGPLFPKECWKFPKWEAKKTTKRWK